MFFGAFFPIVLVVGLGLLVAIIVLMREIRTITGALGRAGSKKPPVSLGQDSPAQELSTRYKPHKQVEPEKKIQENQNEGNSAAGNLWRW
ncbi:MAG TPA: hypothetical protein VMW64_03120 [Dehalococcoidia bacterium]|nr:hypothetical protein [Dehalococcoidia bacterium]